MKIIRKKIILILVILAVVLVGFFVYKRISLSKAEKNLRLNLKNAKIMEVTRGNIEKYLILAGKVDANSATLQFQTSGQLTWVGVKEGDFVKKGQAIASLNKEELKKKLQKYLNDYLTNRWNFEDIQDQYRSTKDNLILTPEIQRILDRKQFSLDNAVLDVEISNLALKYATLISPINGIVTKIDQPNPGVNIVYTTANFIIVDPESIFFRSEVDEEDIKNVSPGQPAEIILDSYPENPLETKVSFISFTPIEGETSTVFRIKFVLDIANPDLKYRVGMNGDAKIKLSESKNTLLVPIEALFEDKGEKFVYTVSPQKNLPVKRDIKTGVENDDQVEITEGLIEGERIFINVSS